MWSRWRNLAGTAVLTGLLFVALGRTAELDPLVPSGAKGVLKLDIKQVLDSALVKKYALPDLQGLMQMPQAQQYITATGLDPLKDLDSVTITAAGARNPPQVLIVVRGRFDAAKINAALAEQAKKDPQLKISKEGKLTIWELPNKEQHPLFGTIASPGAMVLSTDKDYLVKSIADEGKTKPSAELVTAAGKVPAKESIWGAFLVTPEIKSLTESNPKVKKYVDSLKSVTGGLSVTDVLQFQLQGHATSPEAANEIKTALESLKPLLQGVAAMLGKGNEQNTAVFRDLIDAIKISTRESTIAIDLKVNEDLLGKIRKATSGG